MYPPRTLLELAGADREPCRVSSASLVIIDMQNEYLDGPVAVESPAAAIANAERLLMSARSSGAPVIHVAHKGRAGSMFDRASPRGQFVAALAPSSAEMVVEKTLPNAFAQTELHALLTQAGRKDVLLAGFMTHMCVSSTARAAIDFGYRVTIAADACGTRNLPDWRGGVVPASTIHDIALVALSDRFAIIAETNRLI